MATPKQTDPQFKLRLTPMLRDEIEAAAAAHNRSMNAEIVDRLERHHDLARLPMDVAYLEMENQRLTKELAVVRAALDDAKASSFALQQLVENDRGEPGGETISDTPMTPELFHQLFGDMRDRLDRIERKVDRQDGPGAKK